MLLKKKEIVKRYNKNPIIHPNDLPFNAIGVYNSGVIKKKDKYIMIMRVESSDITNHFVKAVSDNGIDFIYDKKEIEIINKDNDWLEYTKEMIYDPRITFLENEYHILFACHSLHGARIGYIKTNDFKKYYWQGLISEPDNRNAVLFPEKINGYYVRLDRPNVKDGGDIWISYSKDLKFWGNSKCVARKGNHGSWDWIKIGAGAVPIKTKKGWLLITHGVQQLCKSQWNYNLGVMLLDISDPSKLIGRSKAPILMPTENYERVGLTPNVVFCSSAVVEDSGEVKIYYGGADTYQCLAISTIDALIDACYNI